MAARFTIQYDIKLTQKLLGLASSIDIQGNIPCPDGTHKAIEENRLSAVSLAINRANSLLTSGWDDYEVWPSNNCVGIWMHETSPDLSVGEAEKKRIEGICKHRHYEVRMNGNRLELVSTQSLSRPPVNDQRILEQIGLAAEQESEPMMSAPAPAPTLPIPTLGIRRSTPPVSSGLLLLCVMALGLLTGCDSPKDYSGPDEALHVAQGHTLGGAL